MQRNDDAQQHPFNRTILSQAPTAPNPTVSPSLSGTGGALAAEAATKRAQDFAAGKIPLAEYASTLKAPNLTYQDNVISAKPTGPGQMRGLVSAIGETTTHVLTPNRVNRSLAVPIEKPVAPTTNGALQAAAQNRAGTISATPAPVFSPTSLTQQQRDTAGDAYRASWQQQTRSSGLREASASALDLYNAEQQVRGSNVTARRSANGVMEFSGNDEGALPQNYTRGFDLNAANERMARANAIRQDYLDAQASADGSPRGGVIGNSAIDETNARFRESALQDSMKSMGRTRMNATVSMRNADVANQRAAAELAMREREGAANRGLAAQAEANRTAIDRQRIDLDREDLGLRSQTTGLASEVARRDLAERDRIGTLRDQYQSEQDPAKRDQLGRTLLTLQGKEPSDQSGRWMLADMETGTTDAMGNPVTRKVPVNPVTGQVFQPGAGQGGAVSGNGRSAPSYEQFAAQIRAKNQGAQIDDKMLSEAYMRQFGQWPTVASN